MRPIIDKEMARTITNLSEMILRQFFYYDFEGIHIFTKNFARAINGEHANLQLNASTEFKFFIWGNPDAQQKFTANFLGFFLLETLANALHFNELELIHFETILSKYLKEVEPVEHAEKYERENHRNPFTSL